jgi:hypothetical protein
LHSLQDLAHQIHGPPTPKKFHARKAWQGTLTPAQGGVELLRRGRSSDRWNRTPQDPIRGAARNQGRARSVPYRPSPSGIRHCHHPQPKSRTQTPQRRCGCATNHCWQTCFDDAWPRQPRPQIGIEPRRRAGVPSAYLVISHRNAEGTGVVGRVASVPEVDARDTFRFGTRTRCSHGRAPERVASPERKEPAADEGCPGSGTCIASGPRVTAVTSAHRSVTGATDARRKRRMKGALTTCLRQVLSSLREDRAPGGRRGRLSPSEPHELRAGPRPFGSRGAAPPERGRRQCVRRARGAYGGGRRAWPSTTCP